MNSTAHEGSAEAAARSSAILAAYRDQHPRSAAMYERASRSIAGGVAHDVRRLVPFPIYMTSAHATRKRDVDGHEYIDYWMGHGALILGHGHPVVVEAVQHQVMRGTHLGACHELEVRWAELIATLVPSAQLVRFTMSGTEATHLALRIARAHTGRSKVVKFEGHFHGWHDGVATAVDPPFDIPMSAGVPASVLEHVLVCPANDAAAVERLLARGDVAAVILEPAGGLSGVHPTVPGFLPQLRSLCTQHDVVLIFDEVITGFRYGPGGAQEYFGVTPDMTTLAKIVAGGLPGAAVVGSESIMSAMRHRGDPSWDRGGRVAQNGTFNANPLTAAAGIAALEILSDGVPQREASERAEELRQRITHVMQHAGVPGACYGESSIYHISFDGVPAAAWAARPRRTELHQKLRCGLLNAGVDCHPYHGWVSAVHTAADVDLTVRAYERALQSMVDERSFDVM
ncbi:MAG TPA: aspartate aminotransferase family protein [Vicinamibacterales bacterium]|nr:aspartate aminotransferase family protein [Vicinamibacterales bacterium]